MVHTLRWTDRGSQCQQPNHCPAVSGMWGTVMSLELLHDWLGSGGYPVSQMKADQRAAACVYGNSGKPCHLNIEQGWWDRIKSAIASTIKKQLQIKHEMKLKSALEDSLFMCQGCGCALPLKVWVATEHIKSHTSTDQIDKMPLWCWQRMEMSK